VSARGATPGADPDRAALDAEVVRWAGEDDWRRDDARFEALALRLFAFQFERCAVYRRFCEARGRTPERVRSWRDVPAVPTAALKEVTLTSFPPERALHTFRTSGTSTAGRGALHLDTLEVYEASLRPAFLRHVLPDLPAGDAEDGGAEGARADFRVLAPDPGAAPDSSLSHMFGVLVRDLGAPQSAWWVSRGALDVERALADLDALARAAGDVPVVLCGTAFAFAHLLEAIDARGLRFALPPGARVMETGGFKGRSRALTREALHGWIETRLGVPATRCVNQYGMTELGSQFHDSVLREPAGPRRKLAPPWTRVRLLDPRADTPTDVAPGDTGRIAIVDLANTGSVLALETGDLGRAVADGFEVLGREPGAEERGCSIAADVLLTAGAASGR